ncbi:hypothetical protein J437_LFUL007415 [Ladona fulva]|uniref:Peptidase S1 domain-containing protein n=1 Tax=Ladona fulva TaxID=123851 RepID=A0A8K0K324_LADFU|nr:hypothetical protein J437_LFUL007415 [Ladona fulva]
MVVEGKLQGIVSWCVGCARPKFLGVYSSVASMRAFFTKEMGLILLIRKNIEALTRCVIDIRGRHASPPKPRLDGRIVGGTDAREGEIPYQISLRYLGSHRCGGSIISEDWAVTAAHCVQGVLAEDLEIMVGSVDINDGTIHQVYYVAYHPNFDQYLIDWDIAVLKLVVRKVNLGEVNEIYTVFKLQVEKPFVFSDIVKAVALPQEGEEPQPEEIAIISGWGYTSEGSGIIPENLQRLAVPIISREECNIDYSDYGGITERMICAGIEEGGKDACQGDSGGPLVIDGKLQGIVSWGAGCARPKHPGVYSRVSAMRSFLFEETGL